MLKSSYPTYTNPYSHDISALTNAHRNQVNGSRDFDSRLGRGGETYRKYNDESSGYKSMPSPDKQTQSSSDSISRKSNQVSSRLNQTDENGYSPTHHHSLSPQRFSDADAVKYPDDHSAHLTSSGGSPRISKGLTANKESSPERHNYSNQKGKGDRGGASTLDGFVDDDDAVNYNGRQTEDRDMMSATPNTSSAAPHLLNNDRQSKREPGDEQSVHTQKQR